MRVESTKHRYGDTDTAIRRRRYEIRRFLKTAIRRYVEYMCKNNKISSHSLPVQQISKQISRQISSRSLSLANKSVGSSSEGSRPAATQQSAVQHASKQASLSTQASSRPAATCGNGTRRAVAVPCCWRREAAEATPGGGEGRIQAEATQFRWRRRDSGWRRRDSGRRGANPAGGGRESRWRQLHAAGSFGLSRVARRIGGVSGLFSFFLIRKKGTRGRYEYRRSIGVSEYRTSFILRYKDF